MQDSGIKFLGDLLQSIRASGLNLLGRPSGINTADLGELAELLLSRRGEVSGIALGRMLLDSYAAAGRQERLEFLLQLARRWGADQDRVGIAIQRFQQSPSLQAMAELNASSEPRRQEILRRLNMAPGGTRDLIAIRKDVLAERHDHPELSVLDGDFVHLFASWFNRGFLQLRAIEWSTPANVLEKIIEYEAVHEISDWNALRARLLPEDRRCFAFFHPQLPDEPLIFVEVALTREVSTRIDTLLSPQREPVEPVAATTAIFYSISNCQAGLAGVSFGGLLIKQVVDDLRHELPKLRQFATLSPMPSFAKWLERERASDAEWIGSEMRQRLSLLDEPNWVENESKHMDLREALLSAATHYLLKGKDRVGRPLDRVAKFHLGNGARLEQINFLGDVSPKGLAQSYGLMVNYLYALDEIERNHESYAQTNAIAASSTVRRKLQTATILD